jgi:prepilin-type N-terminal cleavage/methylation domain-containing protein
MKRVLQRMYGFTLVEILVVIFVIGILAALVINSISGSTERS